MSNEKIRTIYEMMYPYGFYNEELASTCLIIDKELRTLCKNNMRHILLLIGRYLGHVYTSSTLTSVICQEIQNDIRFLCLGGLSDPRRKHRNPPLNDTEIAQYIIGLKTGMTDFGKNDKLLSGNDRLICRDIKLSFGGKTTVADDIERILKSILTLGQGYFLVIMNYIRTYKHSFYKAEYQHQRLLKDMERGHRLLNLYQRNDGVSDVPLPLRSIEELRQYIIKSIPKQYIDLIEQGKYNDIFRLEYEEHKELFTRKNILDAYDENEDKYIINNPSQVDFILKLVEMILSDEIQIAHGPPNDIKFLTWEDLC